MCLGKKTFVRHKHPRLMGAQLLTTSIRVGKYGIQKKGGQRKIERVEKRDTKGARTGGKCLEMVYFFFFIFQWHLVISAVDEWKSFGGGFSCQIARRQPYTVLSFVYNLCRFHCWTRPKYIYIYIIYIYTIHNI